MFGDFSFFFFLEKKGVWFLVTFGVVFLGNNFGVGLGVGVVFCATFGVFGEFWCLGLGFWRLLGVWVGFLGTFGVGVWFIFDITRCLDVFGLFGVFGFG